MACMARMLPRDYETIRPDNRVKELEDRVEKLESLIERLMKSNKPSFQDFKFLKEDDNKKEREDEAKAKRVSRAMMSRNMFTK
jgi:hypothetical protein